MANSHLHFGVGARVVRIAAIVATALLGMSMFFDGATAQTPPKKPADKKAAPPAKGETSNPQSAWVKLCEKGTANTKDKDGKEQKKDLNVCMTHHERIDGNSGMVMISAALQQMSMDGKDKQNFMLMVPLGMLLQPGTRATFYPASIWEKMQKNEKIDPAEDAKMKAIALKYTLCHAGGCVAEMEATPELLTNLKSSAGMVVFAIGPSGVAAAFPVPLTGFEQALAGPAVDTQKYGEARKALMMQIIQRQQELAAEMKKQNEDLQKMQGGVVPPKAPAPPPAKK